MFTLPFKNVDVLLQRVEGPNQKARTKTTLLKYYLLH